MEHVDQDDSSTNKKIMFNCNPTEFNSTTQTLKYFLRGRVRLEPFEMDAGTTTMYTMFLRMAYGSNSNLSCNRYDTLDDISRLGGDTNDHT